MQNTIYLNKLLHRCKVTSEITPDVNNFLYVRSKWLENEVDFIFLFSVNNECYKSRITTEDFVKTASELDRNYKEFHDECKQALTANVSLPGFVYEVDIEELAFRLIRCEDFETEYLELNLERVTPNHICDMLDIAIDKMDVQQRQQQSNVNSFDAKLLQQYHAYVDKSKLNECFMLEQFILLLNSKKKRIRELEEELLKIPNGQSSDSKDERLDETLDTMTNEKNNGAVDDSVYSDDTQQLTPPGISTKADNQDTFDDDETE